MGNRTILRMGVVFYMWVMLWFLIREFCPVGLPIMFIVAHVIFLVAL